MQAQSRLCESCDTTKPLDKSHFASKTNVQKSRSVVCFSHECKKCLSLRRKLQYAAKHPPKPRRARKTRPRQRHCVRCNASSSEVPFISRTRKSGYVETDTHCTSCRRQIRAEKHKAKTEEKIKSDPSFVSRRREKAAAWKKSDQGIQTRRAYEANPENRRKKRERWANNLMSLIRASRSRHKKLSSAPCDLDLEWFIITIR